MTTDTHVTWHAHPVSRAHREALDGQRGGVIWLTGVSGSGRRTLANTLDHHQTKLKP